MSRAVRSVMAVRSTVEVDAVALEVLQHPAAPGVSLPPLVLLHEGLGSVTLWKDFPRRLAERLGTDVIAYSRAGYGRSGPADWPWGVDFMHRQAAVLAKLIETLELPAPPVLVGHSDGGSIALIAARAGVELAGLVVMAPHVFVEQVTVESIEALARSWADPGFRRRFAFYHRHAEALFEGWRRVWLSPEFRRWDIRPLLGDIHLPVLAIQGEEDLYGTMAQIDHLARLATDVRQLRLPDCGHSPHRDRPEPVVDAITDFVAGL